MCYIQVKNIRLNSFYEEKKIKLCLTKQLLNKFKLWCEWGIRYCVSLVFSVFFWMWSFVDFDFCLVPDTKISTWFKVMKLKPDWRTFNRKLMIESAIYPPNILDLLLYQWIMYNALYDVLMFCLFFLFNP